MSNQLTPGAAEVLTSSVSRNSMEIKFCSLTWRWLPGPHICCPPFVTPMQFMLSKVLHPDLNMVVREPQCNPCQVEICILTCIWLPGRLTTWPTHVLPPIGDLNAILVKGSKDCYSVLKPDCCLLKESNNLEYPHTLKAPQSINVDRIL